MNPLAQGLYLQVKIDCTVKIFSIEFWIVSVGSLVIFFLTVLQWIVSLVV